MIKDYGNDNGSYADTHTTNDNKNRRNIITIIRRNKKTTLGHRIYSNNNNCRAIVTITSLPAIATKTKTKTTTSNILGYYSLFLFFLFFFFLHRHGLGRLVRCDGMSSQHLRSVAFGFEGWV